MGRLEKYGVCALLFVIVTVLAVSIWGPRPKKGAAAGSPDPKAAAAEKEPAPSPLAGSGGARPLGEVGSRLPDAGALGKDGLPSPAPLLPSGAASPSPFDAPEIPVAGSAKPIEAGGLLPGRTPRTIVRRGETLELIAKRELGSAAKWEEILKWNEGIDPKRLRAGQEIALPPSSRLGPAPAEQAPAPETAAAAPAAAASLAAPGPEPLSTATVSAAKSPPAAPRKAGRTHRVAKGDTLYALSKHYYGRGTRYRDILDANRGVLDNEHALRVGMTLVIP